MRGGVALEEQNETKTAKQPVISGKVLWVALGACVVWLAAVGGARGNTNNQAT